MTGVAGKVADLCGLRLYEQEASLIRALSDGSESIPVSTCPPLEISRSTHLQERFRIRAKLLQCLILDRRMHDLLQFRRMEVKGAYIEGPLNLDSAEIQFPVIFEACYIPSLFHLRDATTLLFSLKGSLTGVIKASRIHVKSSLVLNDGFQAMGEVHLHGAVINGHLDARNATFGTVNASSDHCPCALMADDITVNGDAYLTDIAAHGMITLNAAKMGDDLDLRGSTLHGCDGNALHADRICIGGNLLLGGGPPDPLITGRVMNVIGTLSFADARITGNVYCRSTRLLRNGQITFDARQSRIAGSAYFEDAFHTNGVIRLTGTQVGGCLYFNGACFDSEYRTGVIAKAMTVNGTFAWTAIHSSLPQRSPLLQLDLRYAHVGHLEDDRDSWPAQGNLLLDGLTYDSLAHLGAPNESAAERITRWIRTAWSPICGRPRPNPPRHPRLAWIERQFTLRLTESNVTDMSTLAGRIFPKNSDNADSPSELIVDRYREMLFDADARRIASNLKVRQKPSTMDSRELLLALNLLLHDPNLPDRAPKTLTASARAASTDSTCWARNLSALITTFGELQAPPRPIVGYFRPQPYEQLAAFLKKQGETAEAVSVLIAKEDAKKDLGHYTALRRAWKLILKSTVGYGYRPELAGLWAALVVGFGAVVFANADQRGLMVPAKEYVYAQRTESANQETESATNLLPLEYPDFHPVTYSFDAFLPIIDLHQKSFWLPAETAIQAGRWKKPEIEPSSHEEPKNDNGQAKEAPPGQSLSPPGEEANVSATLPSPFLHIWLWIEIAVGWLLTSLFVAGVFGFLHTSEAREPHMEGKRH